MSESLGPIGVYLKFVHDGTYWAFAIPKVLYNKIASAFLKLN